MPDACVGALEKSAMLKYVAPKPNIPLRQAYPTWAAFWRTKFPPLAHEFVCATLWCKLLVHARLHEWIMTNSCPLCGVQESVQNGLSHCKYLPLVHDMLHSYYVCTLRPRSTQVSIGEGIYLLNILFQTH